MSAQKAIRYSVNLASEFQPPPPLFQEGATHAFHMYVYRKKLPHLSLPTFLNEWNAYNKTLGMLKK